VFVHLVRNQKAYKWYTKTRLANFNRQESHVIR